jgi:hypothetical protein
MSKTITGCYDGGSIVFEGEACDSGDYTGCYVSSGVHEGQIAITFSETNCEEDTYYACLSSGSFSAQIPEDCCAGNCCNETTGACSEVDNQGNCANTWYGNKNCHYCGTSECTRCAEGDTPYAFLLTLVNPVLDDECHNGEYQWYLTGHPPICGVPPNTAYYDSAHYVEASFPAVTCYLMPSPANCRYMTTVDGFGSRHLYYYEGCDVESPNCLVSGDKINTEVVILGSPDRIYFSYTIDSDIGAFGAIGVVGYINKTGAEEHCWQAYGTKEITLYGLTSCDIDVEPLLGY